MKRILSLALICFVLAFSLAVPAFATEIDNYDSINLLDYFNPGMKYTDPGRNSVTLTFPGYLKYEYLDFVVQAPSGLSSVYQVYYGGEYELTVIPIGEHCYRIYGGIAYEGRSVEIIFVTPQSSESTQWLSFLSCFVYKAKLLRFDTEAYCEIASAEFNGTIHYIPTDEINHRIFSSTSDFQDTYFITYIWTDDWRKYDYIDFQLMYECFDITSVTAVMGSVNVPLVVSYIDGTNIDNNTFYVSMRMDVTGLDRGSADYPMIILMGRLNTGGTNSIDFANCSGYVKQAFFDPLFYYFYDLKNELRSWMNTYTNRIVDALNGNSTSGNEFKNDTSGLISDLGDITASMDSVVRPNFVGMDITAGIDISSASYLMSSFFNQVAGVPWISQIILLSGIMGLIAYILYGKE
ncbi:MAG: hypothetical protein E7465_06885 [Ruminococcaceae bacterium]|nr:hypothetical protein [Oscillospiraceae bacterium]